MDSCRNVIFLALIFFSSQCFASVDISSVQVDLIDVIGIGAAALAVEIVILSFFWLRSVL